MAQKSLLKHQLAIYALKLIQDNKMCTRIQLKEFNMHEIQSIYTYVEII